jgi:hypothetical protein
MTPTIGWSGYFRQALQVGSVPHASPLGSHGHETYLGLDDDRLQQAERETPASARCTAAKEAEEVVQ